MKLSWNKNIRKNHSLFKWLPIISLAITIIVFFISFFTFESVCNNETEKKLYLFAKEKTSEVDSTLESQMDTLTYFSHEISTNDINDRNIVIDKFNSYIDKTEFKYMGYSSIDGISYINNSETINIYKEDFFLDNINGEKSLGRILNYKNEDLLVLSVPIFKNNEIIGTINGYINSNILENKINTKTYKKSSFSILCDKSGDIILDYTDGNYNINENNIYKSLDTNYVKNSSSIDNINDELIENGYSFLPCSLQGNKEYIISLPLNFNKINSKELVLVNIVPAKNIDIDNISYALKHGLLIAVLALTICIIFGYIIYRERKVFKQIEEKNNEIRLKEQIYRMALKITKQDVALYDINKNTYISDSENLKELGYNEIIENVPEIFIKNGNVASDSVEAIIDFYNCIKKGENNCSAILHLMTSHNRFLWFKVNAKIIFKDNKPYQAIIVYSDITEQRLKEAIYVKWQNSLSERSLESYTLFKCNLSKGTSFDSVIGTLIDIDFKEEICSFNDRTLEYAGQKVYRDDFDEYIKILNSDHLLAEYCRGKHSTSFDYREIISGNFYRWLRVNIDMIEYSDSKDIEVYLMYENIDEEKNSEILTKKEIESDSLTGILNRAAFIEKFEAILHSSRGKSKNALILLDIDGFKLINDNFGHNSGDNVLKDVASTLREIMTNKDLIGRLGGDEFLICLKDIPSREFVERKTAQILSKIREVNYLNIQITGSAGVAISPNGGEYFDVLYKNVDVALYEAKRNGRNTFVIFEDNLEKSVNIFDDNVIKEKENSTNKKLLSKNKMIIIDNNLKNIDKLKSIFDETFNVVDCIDLSISSIKIQRYSISIILLSNDLPNNQSFEIINSIKSDNTLSLIPLIVFSKKNEIDNLVSLFKLGISDYICSLIDEDIIKTKVNAVLVKEESESDRLYKKSVHLNDEEKSKYRLVLESTGTIVIEEDLLTNKFTYDVSTPAILHGTYDDRSLWYIFLSDMVASSQDVKKMQNLIMELANNPNENSISTNVILKTKNKERHWFKMMAFKMVNEYNSPTKIIITFSDINENVFAENKLIFRSEHDLLTGLLNRCAFLNKAEELAKNAPCNTYILFSFDIDRFRLINERFGREEGDKLLIYAAKKIRHYAEINKTICSRLSNDYFALILKNDKDIFKIANEKIKVFFDNYPLNTKILLKGGACVIDDPSLPMDTMIDRASIARKTIKVKYISEIALFDEKMLNLQKIEKEITEKMEQALSNNEFSIYLQPQFNHLTGKLVGAEALVRWTDSKRGIIPPNEFIPLFESNGFITKLDEYVWRKAAECLSNWMKKYEHYIPISVNVSLEDIKDYKFCEKIISIIDEYKLPRNMFRLEITEGMFVDDAEYLKNIINILHSFGFLVEMDDFGSGYSSLNILKEIPVDVIKLDMKFFSGHDDFNKGDLIINAVVRMSRWLNIPVIAEGVETKEQADFLLSIGCKIIQGYYYSRPLTVDMFEKTYLNDSSDKNIDDSNYRTMTLLDNEKLDSQLFNDFLEASIIIEYQNDNLEIIRMNKAFMRLFDVNDVSIFSPTLDAYSIYDNDISNLKQLIKNISNKDEIVEADIHKKIDNKIINLHLKMHLITRKQNTTLVYCEVKYNNDINN